MDKNSVTKGAAIRSEAEANCLFTSQLCFFCGFFFKKKKHILIIIGPLSGAGW